MFYIHINIIVICKYNYIINTYLSVIRGSKRCSQSSQCFESPEITCGIPLRRLPGPEETFPALQRLGTPRVLLA